MDFLIAPFNPLGGAGQVSQVEAQFRGKDRKVAKTSIANASVEDFASLEALLATLPSDDAMQHHSPKITRDLGFDRVAEEQRNVRVPAFICAIKYEADQDWHIIGANDSRCDGPIFFNFEVSGLPAKSAPSRAALATVRQQLSDLLGGELPGSGGYFDYKDGGNPIPVVIQGSLFYDVDHAPGVVGPANMKPTTSWEIHPVTDLSSANDNISSVQ